MSNNQDGNDNAFRTQRMQIMSGLNPSYTPGEFVFLNSPMPGFPDGTRFKVVAARALGTGQYRYELQANGQTIWVLEADLRTTPAENIDQAAAADALSVTQRMQTMTLTQRMAALGVGNDDTDGNTTQRLRILGAGGPPAPEINGPVTGAPFSGDATAPGAQAANDPGKPDPGKPGESS